MKLKTGSTILWTSCGVLVVVGLTICGCSLTRVGYETAEYQVTDKEAEIEIRKYPALDLVSTPMSKAGDAEDGSFKRLFGYISGENKASQKISMTTPVFMEEGQNRDQMSFVIPKEVATEGVPEGTNPSVSVTKLSEGRYAVYRLKSARSDADIDAAKRSLKGWMQAKGYEIGGPFIVAGYDPPFIPAMFQRNEVMVRLK